MEPSAVFLDDNPLYKDFVILFVRAASDEKGVQYRGRAENIAVPGGFERKVQFDSDIHRSINEVYAQLTHYIDLYRKVN